MKFEVGQIYFTNDAPHFLCGRIIKITRVYPNHIVYDYLGIDGYVKKRTTVEIYPIFPTRCYVQ